MDFWGQFWTTIVVIEWTIILILLISMLFNWIKHLQVGPFSGASTDQLLNIYEKLLDEYMDNTGKCYYALADVNMREMKKISRELDRRNRGGK